MIDILNVLENKFDIKFLKYEVDYLRWYYFVEKIKMDKVEMVIQKQFKKYEYFAFALFYFLKSSIKFDFMSHYFV